MATRAEVKTASLPQATEAELVTTAQSGKIPADVTAEQLARARDEYGTSALFWAVRHRDLPQLKHGLTLEILREGRALAEAAMWGGLDKVAGGVTVEQLDSRCLFGVVQWASFSGSMSQVSGGITLGQLAWYGLRTTGPKDMPKNLVQMAIAFQVLPMLSNLRSEDFPEDLLGRRLGDCEISIDDFLRLGAALVGQNRKPDALAEDQAKRLCFNSIRGETARDKSMTLLDHLLLTTTLPQGLVPPAWLKLAGGQEVKTWDKAEDQTEARHFIENVPPVLLAEHLVPRERGNMKLTKGELTNFLVPAQRITELAAKEEGFMGRAVLWLAQVSDATSNVALRAAQ